MGWTVAARKTRPSPNSQNCWVWPYLGKGSLQRYLFKDPELRSSWIRLESKSKDWCPTREKKRKLETPRYRDTEEKAKWGCRRRLERCGHGPRKIWNNQKLEKGRKDPPLVSQREGGSANTSRQWENKATMLVLTFSGSKLPRKLIHRYILMMQVSR